MLDHQSLMPRIVEDAIEADIANDTMHAWFDKDMLNEVLAEIEPHQVICFVTTLCGETHAGYRIVHAGKQTAFHMERFPLLEHGAALGKALKMWEESEEGRF